jgi:hypothetical protein
MKKNHKNKLRVTDNEDLDLDKIGINKFIQAAKSLRFTKT